MELTWVTITASLAMGLSAAFLFIFAVKQDWLRDLEETKYQVFWSDMNEGGPSAGSASADSSSARVLPVSGASPAIPSEQSPDLDPTESLKASREAADDSQSEKK